MNEQVSLSFSILPEGNATTCLSVMPFIDGVLVPEAQTSAIVGSHNIEQEAEAKFVSAIKSAIIEFRTAKGI